MWAKAVVSVGAIVGMSNSIVGITYAVSRVIYAMAEDGLLPKALQKTFRQVRYSLMRIAQLRLPEKLGREAIERIIPDGRRVLIVVICRCQ